VNAPLPQLSISGLEGGKTDGSPFMSSSLSGQVTVIYFVDPDVRDLNSAFYDAAKAASFPADSSKSVAIINMAATLMPNFVLEGMLSKKQKKFPRTIYVRDRHRVTIRAWDLEDHSSCVTIVNAKGIVIYSKCGRIPDAEIAPMIQMIWAEIRKK